MLWDRWRADFVSLAQDQDAPLWVEAFALATPIETPRTLATAAGDASAIVEALLKVAGEMENEDGQ